MDRAGERAGTLGFLSTAPLPERKAAARGAARAALAALSPEARRHASAAIARSLEPALGGVPGVIGAFWPLADEPDIVTLLVHLHAAGWTVALPEFAQRDATFEFRRWDPAITPPRSARGIRMPGADQPTCPAERLTHILLPGVAFDLRGGRLGRGGGMYDRYVPHAPAARFGVCFACQVLEDVPCAEHDARVHFLADERGVRAVNPS